MKLFSSPFFSFLKKKPIPTREELHLLYQDTFSFYKAVLLTLSVAVVVLFLYILLALSNSFSVEIPDKGGTLTIGVTGAPHTIHPFIATTPTDSLLSQLTYSGLIKPSAYQDEIIPDLAQSVVASPDQKEYTFTIRDDLFFSNKASLTVNDVVFSFETKKRMMLDQNPESDWGYIFVEALDTRTIRIRTTGSAQSLFPILSLGIISKDIWQDIPYKSYEDSTLITSPVSSGPYILKRISYKKTVPQYVTLKRNAQYRVSTPNIETIVLNIYANQPSLRKAVEKHDIDLTTMLTPEYLQDIPQRVSIFPIATTTSLSLFVQPNQQDSAVAKAISLVEPFIDKHSVLDTINYGYGMLENTASNTSTQADTTKTTEAFNALSKSGYVKDSSGVLTKNGTPIALSILVQKDDAFLKSAQTLADELSTFGILVELKVFDQGLFIEHVYEETYTYVLAETSDYTKKYHTLVPLYTYVIPLVHTSSVHTDRDKQSPQLPVQSNSEVFTRIEQWYVRTDRIWKWFQR